jgi:DNA polymerase-1
MTRRWLLVDSNFLCHRAAHAFDGLAAGDTETGVVFGFLRDLDILLTAGRSLSPVFCFDSRNSKRQEEFPGYKGSRREKREKYTDEEARQFFSRLTQMTALQEIILPAIGYRNVLSADGFEADDLIAQVIRDNPDDDHVIVSADSDLFQLIRGNVSIWNPASKGDRDRTLQWFWKEYGIMPEKWRLAKSIAGDISDDIGGVPGVGIKTAIKFIRGELGKKTKAYQSIREAKDTTIRRNYRLVGLPFPGTPSVELQSDRFSPKVWDEVCHEYGLSSLVGEYPRHG